MVNDFLSLNTFLNICQKFSSHSCSFDIISAQKKHTGVCGIPGAVNGDEQEVVSTHIYFVSSEKKISISTSTQAFKRQEFQLCDFGAKAKELASDNLQQLITKRATMHM